MITRTRIGFAFLMALTAIAGCSTAPQTENGKQNLSDEVQTQLNAFKRADSGLQNFLSKSSTGYVMFPAVGEGGAVVGGAYGKGELFEGDQMVGYADMSQASVGLQLGGQEYSELIVFGTPDALNRFKDGKLTFGADASAVALKAGASSAASFNNGVAVFTQAKGGLMFQAAIAGQKFTFEPNQGSNSGNQ